MTYSLQNIQQIAEDIKSIKIQWATNIAKAACAIIKQEIAAQPFSSLEEGIAFFEEARSLLEKSRSTEPLLFNLMKYITYTYYQIKEENIESKKKGIIEACDKYLEWIKKNDERIVQTGAEIVKSGHKIFTHCHSSAVVKTLIEAHKQNPDIEVRNTETRPLYQGRKTSAETLAAGIKTTMITDDAAAYFIDKTVELNVDVDMLIVWCDAIKRNGNIINKVGSFGIALSAHNSQIPVYVLANLLKTDADNTVTIETRWGQEIRPEAPKWLNILNYAFDTIPAGYITWLVTEFWVIKPSEVENIIHEYYPWMTWMI